MYIDHRVIAIIPSQSSPIIIIILIIARHEKKVASSPSNRLPTLKELIGYRANEYTSDPVLFSLLPLAINNEQVVPRERDANFVVNGDASFSNETEFSGGPRGPWSLSKINEKKDELDFISDKVDSYRIEDNLADDEDASSFVDRKRIDRQDSTVIPKPTTMRGIPLVRLLHDQLPRGFYVTKSEMALRSPEKTKNDAFASDSTTENPTTVIVEEETSPETTKSDKGRSRARNRVGSATRSTESESFETFSTSMETETTTFAPPMILSTDSTPPESSSASFAETESSVTESLNSTSFEHSTTESLFSAETESDSSTNAIATDSLETVTETVLNEEQTSSTTTSLPLTTVAEKRFNGRREKFGSEFGQKSSGRTRVRQREHREDLLAREAEDTQNPRRRVTVFRGRQRKPVSTGPARNYSIVRETFALDDEKSSKVTVEPIEEESEEIGRTTLSSNEEEDRRIEESSDRFEAEVNSSNSSKNTSTHSAGSLLASRSRKPAAAASTPQRSKSSNTFTNRRKNRPTDVEHALDNEKLDAVDKTTDVPKLEKDIDQSSRAQEIAVTLADPPPPQSSTTGRPALRNAFRRKISTTIAPRKDATTTTTSPTTTTTTTTTTSRSSFRFTPVLRDRQKPRTRDKSVEKATARPRRPQVIDYDYYEDEEESVIGKSTFNGKLFLTSKGSIRCLDQGNFPHPYSCRKFITCARMVNGLVVGAEYTCPDKLSFDPVGGICNWSAGLGCKD